MNKFKKQQFISQRLMPTGRWTFQVQINKDNIIDRKNFSEKEYGSSRAAYDAAIIYRDNVLNKIRNEKYNKKSNKTILDCFNESFDIFPLRVSTVKKHKGMFNKFINLDLKIQDLNSAIIQLSLNNMIEISSDDTIQRVYLIWKRIIKTAIINSYINENLILKIKCPKSHYISKRHIKKQTSSDELDDVIKLIKNSNFKDKNNIINLLLMLYHTGMRPGEVLALNKDDIDLKNNIIHINKELGSSLNESGVIRDTKTYLSNRIIPISEKLKIVIKNQLKDNKYNILFSKEGKYYSSTEIGNRIRLLCRKNNIDFYMYQLRHLFSSNLIDKGVDARTHQELMGHANYSMSVNYASSNIEKKKKILDDI